MAKESYAGPKSHKAAIDQIAIDMKDKVGIKFIKEVIVKFWGKWGIKTHMISKKTIYIRHLGTFYYKYINGRGLVEHQTHKEKLKKNNYKNHYKHLKKRKALLAKQGKS